MFARLGPWCHDRRKLVLILWVAALILINGVAGSMGSAFRDDLDLPDVESRDGFDLLDEQFGAGAPNVVLLVTADDGDVERLGLRMGWHWILASPA